MNTSPVKESLPELPVQGGLSNPELFAAWDKKLPGLKPTAEQISAFAIGIEVGVSHAQDLERQDWSRVHDVLQKHGVHPGRTDDHLADVIDRALQAIAAPREGLKPEQIEALKQVGLSVFQDSRDACDAVEWTCAMLRVHFEPTSIPAAPLAVEATEK